MNDVHLLAKNAQDLDKAGCYAEADILDNALKRQAFHWPTLAPKTPKPHVPTFEEQIAERRRWMEEHDKEFDQALHSFENTNGRLEQTLQDHGIPLMESPTAMA